MSATTRGEMVWGAFLIVIAALAAGGAIAYAVVRWFGYLGG